MKNILLGILILVAACGKEKPKTAEKIVSKDTFNPKSFVVQDTDTKKIRGQIVYLPIYSEIPYLMDSTKLSASAFATIHNTDFYHSIKVSKVLFFDNDGNLVKDFLKNKTLILKPLGATNFYIPHADKSGTGANFIIEWISDSPVTEPLMESVMINLQGVQSMSFLSQGKVVRQMK